jgi:ABC-type lipoprotein export system ATPase subunit
MSPAESARGPIASLAGIGRRFGNEVEALRDVTFDVSANGSTAVVGASGSGKSTLLSILGLLDAPTAGRYRLDGVDTATIGERERTGLRRSVLAFVFQAFHLVPHLTAQENVEEGLRIAGVPLRERRDRAAAALRDVGLDARRRERPNRLSGGEQQRVAVARALVRRPRMLLCDEPTGNLDSRNAARLLDLLLAAADEECAVVIVTHDVSLARRCTAELRVVDGIVERSR